ncbi:hypothetical protein Fmac_013627 [Flemingia macrophylla]|uniref:Senescence regulator n=1 Tax=Flemingia macrophylla TaxID=520843 RepID=A0ABD1MU64_9FABA
MAKGRKFGGVPRTERFLGATYWQGSGGAESSEFREEEVWSMVEEQGREAEANREWGVAWRRNRRHVGGLSLALEDRGSTRGQEMATSAPVNVPDWSKILRVESLQVPEEDTDSEMVPPHEYLARSRKMASNSVFEGVGRTLKGRDMRRVRDAVWSQTGFDG